MLGGGTGPATGTNATTCTPGPWNIGKMLQATDFMPMNLGFMGKGNASLPIALEEQLLAGACGLKLHEDWGTTPAAIDNCLNVAEAFDIQVAIHTDTLNESGFVEETLKAISGRTIHTYHTEGAGGGHAPDIIKAAGLPNILPSSTIHFSLEISVVKASFSLTQPPAPLKALSACTRLLKRGTSWTS